MASIYRASFYTTALATFNQKSSTHLLFCAQDDSVNWFFAQKEFLRNLADWKSFFVIFVYPLIPSFVPVFGIFWFSPVFAVLAFLRNIQISSSRVFLNFFKKFGRKNIFRFYVIHFDNAFQKDFSNWTSSKSLWNSNCAFTAGAAQAPFLSCFL